MSNEEIKNKYSNGIIYAIRSDLTDKFYIGSTYKSLNKRFYEHAKKSQLHIKHGIKCTSSHEIIKLGEAHIELLEKYPCDNKEELHKREGELIRQHKKDVVNIVTGQGLTKEQQRHTSHKEIHKCECGCSYTLSNKSKHIKSIIHLRKLNKYCIDAFGKVDTTTIEFKNDMTDLIKYIKIKYLDEKTDLSNGSKNIKLTQLKNGYNEMFKQNMTTQTFKFVLKKDIPIIEIKRDDKNGHTIKKIPVSVLLDHYIKCGYVTDSDN